MNFIVLLKFSLTLLFIILALVGVVYAIRRALRNNQAWKKFEPGLVKDIEKSTGQRIVAKTMLNATHSANFTAGDIFWLWLAFTPDYIVLIARDEIAEQGGEGHLFIARRKDASIKPLKKSYAELEFKGWNTPESLRLTVLVRQCDYESLTGHIREIR